MWPPANPDGGVDYHYVCFVKSHKNGHLYELDGGRKGPVDLGHFAGDDVLSEEGLAIIKELHKPIHPDLSNCRLCMFALVPRD